MQKPSILLAMPMDNQIYEEIEKNLIHYGFEVIVLMRDLIEQRKPYWGADFALFIRADMFSDELLAQIRPTIRQKMVCYQWDGINRFGNALERVKWFDRFFVFNVDDLSLNAKLEPASNFYLDYNLDHRILVPFWDIYFTGSHLPNRAEKVNKFAHFLSEMGGVKSLLNVVCWERITPELARQYYPANVNILTTGISFQQNLEYAKQSKILVDFLENVHKGLSFRTFEALAYRKKLITTNPELVKYDFYHPNNIFVWDGENFEGLAEFLTTPYHEIDPHIRQKYSFGNWIRYLFDFQPYQPINLPR